ncbi:hypothetical protein FQZ97_940350 [compost metagenome]
MAARMRSSDSCNSLSWPVESVISFCTRRRSVWGASLRLTSGSSRPTSFCETAMFSSRRPMFTRASSSSLRRCRCRSCNTDSLFWKASRRALRSWDSFAHISGLDLLTSCGQVIGESMSPACSTSRRAICTRRARARASSSPRVEVVAVSSSWTIRSPFLTIWPSLTAISCTTLASLAWMSCVRDTGTTLPCPRAISSTSVIAAQTTKNTIRRPTETRLIRAQKGGLSFMRGAPLSSAIPR